MQGSELKALRKHVGLTQESFAKLLGLSPTFIGLMERGDKTIEPRTEIAARAYADWRQVLREMELLILALPHVNAEGKPLMRELQGLLRERYERTRQIFGALAGL